MTSYLRRRLLDLALRVFSGAAVVLALLPLLSVLGYVFVRGVGGLSLSFFSAEPDGGMAHALVGSLEIVAIACSLGVPLGIMAGVYLAEFERPRTSRVVRLAADVLGGVPSITVGLFVYGVMVLRTRHFSAWAGGLALAILMLPTVVRTTEELLKLVPD